MKISVVVPNFNGRHLLEKNLSSWIAIGADEVIIVDDGSTDNSVAVIRNLKFNLPSGGIKLIQNKKNLGFARAVNRGVDAAHGDIIILLNTDVKPASGLIDIVIPYFKDKKVFGVSFNESQWSWARGIWKDGFIEHKPGKKTDKAHSTLWVSGGSGAFRKSILDKLGGFDEMFAPFYWEDVDISYRAQKRGYTLLWEPKAHVIHEHEATIKRYYSESEVDIIQQRNQLLFIWKNITSEKMMQDHIRALTRRIFKTPGYLRVVLAAVGKLPSVLQKRKQERRDSVISDEQILAQFS